MTRWLKKCRSFFNSLWWLNEYVVASSNPMTETEKTDLWFQEGLKRERREKIADLEQSMFDMPEHQIELETRHYFADGIYVREIDIPAGAILTGKIHRTAHVNVVSKGSILVATEDGEKTISAPCTFVAPPGTKRAGVALEDTVWSTIHPNPSNTADMDRLEAELIAPDFEALESQKCGLISRILKALARRVSS
jgi:quercetin dioxygenase-like cupin family protein